MSKLSNIAGLPVTFELAIREAEKRYRDSHERPYDRSVSTLILPPKIAELRRRHDAEITEDVTDRMPSLFGSSMHSVLEAVKPLLDPTRYIVEKRWYGSANGWTISGMTDLCEYREGGWVVADYKWVKVWEIINGVRPEKIAQVNLYAALLRQNGMTVTGTELVYGFTDWSPSEARRSTNYPLRAHVFMVPLWPAAEAEAFLRERVRLHQEAVSKSDDAIPVCTEEERWQSPAKWAVTKPGRKSALRLCDSYEEAEAFIGTARDLTIEERPSVPRRCGLPPTGYCSVSPFCSWYQANRTQTLEETLAASLKG